MYTIEDALGAWEAAGKYGTKQERLERSKLWLPYYAYLARKKLGTAYQPNFQAGNVVDFLLRENILRPTDHVLDIGAGTGGYSVALAAHCGKVTALDMCPDALRVLLSWGGQQGLTNLVTREEAWENFTAEETFDISFSAMCPAICNQEEILRMERMTNRTCCLLTVMPGSYEKCRMEMMKGLPRKNPGGMVTEAIHYWNVLYLMGRQPGIKCWSQKFLTVSKTAELLEQYRIYFRIFGIDDGISVPYMEKFFAQREIAGEVTDECQMNYALIYWEVPKEERK